MQNVESIIKLVICLQSTSRLQKYSIIVITMVKRSFILFLKRKLIQMLLHLVFWFFVLIFYSYFFSIGNTTFENAFSFSLFLVPITIATTYLSIYKLIPDYLITKRYFRFIIYSFYTLVISSYLAAASVFFSLIYLSGFEYSEMNPGTKNIILVLGAVYLIVFVISAFKLLKINLKQITHTKTLETKILETQLKLKEQELHYLKMQIHPHFLFNTLNTMYGFALQKSDSTPEMILKLSNLLDYLLYQVDKPAVPLSQEINHIRDYISLEQMRFNDRLEVAFQVKECNETVSIAPMIFLPFVENSFKHGVMNNGKLQIEMIIYCEDSQVYFKIKNSNNVQLASSQGIGLENIKKRLELLYKGRYNLDITESAVSYNVELNINLNG